jgi:nicotinamidase-related amidase
MPATCVNLKQAQLVVVDIQEKMLPHVAEHEQVLAQAVRMLRAAVEMQLPITISEQYVRGLGPTVGDIVAAAEGARDAIRLEKTSFSVLRDENLRERIVGLRRPQVLLVGVETHVCVQQTALDLLGVSLRPVVLADAVGSRRPSDREISLDRLRTAGAIVTTVESAIFELLEVSGTELFRRLLPIVR